WRCRRVCRQGRCRQPAAVKRGLEPVAPGIDARGKSRGEAVCVGAAPVRNGYGRRDHCSFKVYDLPVWRINAGRAYGELSLPHLLRQIANGLELGGQRCEVARLAGAKAPSKVERQRDGRLPGLPRRRKARGLGRRVTYAGQAAALERG